MEDHILDELNDVQVENDDEILQYLQRPVNKGDILEYWKTQNENFPTLQKLAKLILAVPASAASSERNFSSAGFLVNERRTLLGENTVDEILFLHSNWE